MYIKIKITILNHGFISKPFYPKRGFQTGCPMSADIFVVIVEFLGDAMPQTIEYNISKWKTMFLK